MAKETEMKPFLRRKALSPSIDITPLIDVVFQLLLFFILTSAIVQPNIQLDLPESARELNRTEVDIVVSVTNDGSIYLNNALIKIEEFQSLLNNVLAENPDAKVILRGDKETRYGNLFSVLDLIESSNAKDFSLAYEVQN